MWPDRRLIDFFKIEFPIVLAPMAGVMDADLVIAAAQGGALGSLPCAMLSAEKAREQIQIIRQRVSAPINMNFFCHKPIPADPLREAAWKERLSPYHQELGLDPASPSNAANRAPFDAAMCEVIEELKPEIVSFHFGLPEPSLLARVRAAGCKVISSATTVREAIWLEEHGVDAIIAQGAEAGGHRGMFLTENIAEQPGTFALVPQVVDAVRVPVIAAGGIADGRGIAAAFALGAAGVQIDGVPALSGIQDFGAAPYCVGARTRRFHRDHQRHDRTPGTRAGEPGDARGRPDFTSGAGISPRGDGSRAIEGGRRKTGQARFHQPLGRAGRAAGAGHAGGGADPGFGRQRAGAIEQNGRLVEWI